MNLFSEHTSTSKKILANLKVKAAWDWVKQDNLMTIPHDATGNGVVEKGKEISEAKVAFPVNLLAGCKLIGLNTPFVYPKITFRRS